MTMTIERRGMFGTGLTTVLALVCPAAALT